MTRVRRDYVNVLQAIEVLQQARAVGCNSVANTLARGLRRASKAVLLPGAAQQSRISIGISALASQQRDQLRSFILNGDTAFPVGARCGYVARNNASRSR